MSEENSPFRENGNEPLLGRSSTIHLPMADSPDAGKLHPSEIILPEITGDLVSGDASAEIFSNAISLDDEESNKSLEEPKVAQQFTPPKMIDWYVNHEKYTFSENFPYLFTPESVEYEKFRQKFIVPTSATISGTDKWLADHEMRYMLHVELKLLEKQKKRGYVFDVNAWQSLRAENIPENHMKRPFSRYAEQVKKTIWLPNRGKKAHATRRQKQQEILNLFKYDVLFMPVNQDQHWSLIVVNKPREIFEKLLAGDFEEEEEQRNAEDSVTQEQDSISELVLPGMTDNTDDNQLASSEDESEKEHQEQEMSVSNNKEGQLDSSSDEEMYVEEARGERDDPANSGLAENKDEPDALGHKSSLSVPAQDTSMMSRSEIEFSELSLREQAPQEEEEDYVKDDHEMMERDAHESEEEGDRALPYDRSDGEDEEDESEDDYSEEGEPTLQELADAREKNFQCPSEDEPAIYLLCSAYTLDWHEKCEVMNEFLTSAFLDRTNESLRDLHEKLLEQGILSEKSDDYYQIEAGGRAPADYFCTKLHLQRQMQHLPACQLPWPCQKCDNMAPCFHNELLPFKYGMPFGPHQCNDFDCGNFAVYFIRRWFDSDRPDMSADSATLKKWFTLRDIFEYKYDCRRYLDKLVGWPDREPKNEQGKADKYGYVDDYDEALTKWTNEKNKRVGTPQAPESEEKLEDKEENEVAKDASAEETDLQTDVPEGQLKENGVHEDKAADEDEKTGKAADDDEKTGKATDASEIQALEKSSNDAQDTPPEVSPHHPQVEIPVVKSEQEKMETPAEEPQVEENDSLDIDSSTFSERNLRRRSSTAQYTFTRSRKTSKTPSSTDSPRRGSFDIGHGVDACSPLVGEIVQPPVRRKAQPEPNVENDKMVALNLYQTILNPRPQREAKTKAGSILSPARQPRARRSILAKAKALPMKRKNEKDAGASAKKRRKTTSSIPVTPKQKQSPKKKVVRRRKTVSSHPEEPVLAPIDSVKFFDSIARFAFSSSLFKDSQFPRTLRFEPPNEAVMLTKPEKMKAKKNAKRRSSRIGTR